MKIKLMIFVVRSGAGARRARRAFLKVSLEGTSNAGTSASSTTGQHSAHQQVHLRSQES